MFHSSLNYIKSHALVLMLVLGFVTFCIFAGVVSIAHADHSSGCSGINYFSCVTGGREGSVGGGSIGAGPRNVINDPTPGGVCSCNGCICGYIQWTTDYEARPQSGIPQGNGNNPVSYVYNTPVKQQPVKTGTTNTAIRTAPASGFVSGLDPMYGDASYFEWYASAFPNSAVAPTPVTRQTSVPTPRTDPRVAITTQTTGSTGYVGILGSINSFYNAVTGVTNAIYGGNNTTPPANTQNNQGGYWAESAGLQMTGPVYRTANANSETINTAWSTSNYGYPLGNPPRDDSQWDNLTPVSHDPVDQSTWDPRVNQ